MRGAGSSAPSQEYHAQSSTAAAAAAASSRRNPGTDDAQIASDFEYATKLQQEMEGLSVDDDGDGMVCFPLLCLWTMVQQIQMRFVLHDVTGTRRVLIVPVAYSHRVS